jgi:tRNA (cytidine/uridine-2'-O-)-methyltransferase
VIPRGQAEGAVLEEGPALAPRFHIALLRPEIGPNAGNAGRLCLGIGARLHLIGPLGFSTDEKAVRRAGLDYWRAVDVMEHADEAAFWSWAEGRRVLLYSARASAPYTAARHQPGDVLLFGPESVGLPAELVEARGAYSIPLPGPVRSLNLANAVAVVAYEALRQLEPHHFLGG